ncbi:Ppx/GppA family phosphatase [Paenibacillus hodogayensis]|uniref:Ppx/GppA family phosphatase n=1 Tax=Paenibacillus hodogayensis TaxID=279208 RepID=A0ABV5VW96_9BACL
MNNERVGIIDIGSNSVRLVVYERIGAKSYRVIDESKESARLSATIAPDGSIPREDILRLARILSDFQMLCRVHEVSVIRAIATAAIRNASNGSDAVEQLRLLTGISIETVSGEEEARLGFVGMINSLPVTNGYLIDIGGGSTEVSLFRDRRLVRSVSFPFGAVNTAKTYAVDGSITADAARRIREMVLTAAAAEHWLTGHPQLPLVGLGGTIRSLSKIDQQAKKYAFEETHHYEMDQPALNALAEWLPTLSPKERVKVDGLSGTRADIIVPGLIILHTLFLHLASSRCIVSGSGLRDGIFYETAFPGEPVRSDVLAESTRNLLDQHPAVSRAHVEHVSRLASALFDDLGLEKALGHKARSLLQTAALLYRIGVTIHFYNYYKHTFYLIVHSRIDGLNHREAVLCALIASFRTKGRTRAMMQPYKDLLAESDLELVYRLGSLLLLATAFDRSETQPIARIGATVDKQDLHVAWSSSTEPAIELREVERIAGDFRKCWGLRIRTHPADLST